MPVKPILILAYGNPSRGDDALAPLLLENLQDFPATLLKNLECITDFQLQIEHALDLKQRSLVLFVDASLLNQHPVELSQLQPLADNSYTSHAMTPPAVMQVYQEIEKQALPPCFLLSLQGQSFELGEDISQSANQNLKQATSLLKKLLKRTTLSDWQALCNA